MIWDLIERVTGVNRQHVKDVLKGKAAEVINQVVCECRCTKFQHRDGKCITPGCCCKGFKSAGLK